MEGSNRNEQEEDQMSGAGYIEGTDIMIDISEEAVNQSILITGDSGSGKTVAMKRIEVERAKAGQNVLAINYGGTHEDILSDDSHYHVIKAKREGIPIPLLEPFSSEDGGKEEDADVCEAITDVFSQTEGLGFNGRYLLEEACQNAIELRETYDDDMECLRDGILLLEEGEAEYLMAKFRKIFKRARFHKILDLWRPGKVTVIDLSGYPRPTQLTITQLILSALWRNHQIYGQRMGTGTMIALDEFQNLPLKDGSILAQILREGRKFNLSLLLATQTLFTFDTTKRIVLQQPGTKLYFKPVETELKKIAKQFPDMAAADAERLLQGLGVGECLACGEFVIAGASKLRTLKVTFREKG